MSMDYAGLADTARGLLSFFGGPVSIIRQAVSIDPVTGADTSPAPQTLASTGLLLPYSDTLIDDTRITARDRQLLLDDSIEPRVTDRVEIGGERWSVMEVVTLKPTDVEIYYRVRVRG